MKKEKNFLKSLLAGVCAASLLFGAVSCANSDDDDSTTTPVKTPTPGDDSGNKGKQDGQGEQPAVVDISYKGPASVPAVSITAPESAGTITMNGTTYNTIQAALNAAVASGDYVITLTAGTYAEDNLHYKGEGNIVISGVAGKTYGTDVLIKGKGDNTSSSTEKNRCTLEFEGTKGNGLILENLTIQNTFLRASAPSKNTQCEALGFDSTGTCAAYNCAFLSHQDTIRTVGKAWFYGCYIEGDVDFIWMEKAGKVALYENCAIRTVTDTDNKEAYIAAPGMNAADVFNKGLVVYNSAIKLDNPTSSLFRNPWGVSEGLYNISAFVNVKVEGTLVAALQKSTASNWNADKNGAIGWKVDQELADAYTSKSSEIHTISEAVEKAEYNGRTRVINRVYKLNPEKYANDSDVWDVNALASSRKWDVTKDNSTLDSASSASVKANGTYKIAEYHTGATAQGTEIADGTSTDGFVSWSGLKYHSAGYGAYASGADATITIQVAGASVISLVGSQYGSGTITMTDAAGNVCLNAYSTKMKTDKTALSFIYNGTSATTLTLTLKPTTYVGDLTVSAWDGEMQKVTKIAVAGDDAVTVGDSVTLKAEVTTQYCAPETVTWSSSDESVATVTSSGVVTGVAAGEALITATSTFDTSKKASIKVTVTAVVTKKATWFSGTAFSASGTTEDSSWFTVGDASFEWGSKATGTASTGYGAVSNVTGAYYQNTGVFAKDDVVGTLTLTLTAKKNIQITKIGGSFSESASGNVSRSVKIGDADTIAIGTGKTIENFSKSDLSVSVASGSSVNIVFTTIATGTIAGKDSAGNSTVAKKMNQLFKDITISCVELKDESVVSENTFFDLRTMLSSCATSGTASTGTAGKKLKYSAMYYKDSQHGAWFYHGSTLNFKVSGACKIYLGTEQYGNTTFNVSDGSASLTVDNKTGTTLATSVTGDMTSDSTVPYYEYTGTSEATITISLTNTSSQAYLPAVQVKF